MTTTNIIIAKKKNKKKKKTESNNQPCIVYLLSDWPIITCQVISYPSVLPQLRERQNKIKTIPDYV